MVAVASQRYEIVGRLAGGGMAELFLARVVGMAGFERLVAVKRLAPQLATNPAMMQALFDEARISASLSHANIVQVNDVEVVDGQVSIVMEFLHGHDVSHLLRRLARDAQELSFEHAVSIMLGVCAGLHHAHESVGADGRSLEIVHRDVSPHNVFVTYDGAVKLVDFGIARATSRRGHTEAGIIKGKPGYIAPEQLRGTRVDRRTDVWGAGVLLYEMTTGSLPFGEATSLDQLVVVINEDPPPPAVADYPPELAAIVMRAIARDPDARYPTAEALRADLEAFARTRGFDLSPFSLRALMERVFAQQLGAWRQAQRDGRSLADHVASRASRQIEVIPASEDTVLDAEPAPPAEIEPAPRSSDPTDVSRAVTQLAAEDTETQPQPLRRATAYGMAVAPPRVASQDLVDPRAHPIVDPRRRRRLRIALTIAAMPIVVIAGMSIWSMLDKRSRPTPVEREIAAPAVEAAKQGLPDPAETRPVDEPPPAEATKPVDPPAEATKPVDPPAEATKPPATVATKPSVADPAPAPTPTAISDDGTKPADDEAEIDMPPTQVTPPKKSAPPHVHPPPPHTAPPAHATPVPPPAAPPHTPPTPTHAPDPDAPLPR